MRLIKTHARYEFLPARVWAILSDFPRYAEWNPLNISASGEARPGARAAMAFIDPGRPGRIIRQTVRILSADSPRRLEWLGQIPILFSGRHYFELIARAGGTDLVHGEKLSGLVPALWNDERVELQRRAYMQFNEALARRLEQLFGSS